MRPKTINNPGFSFWFNWSIRQRLLLITLLPVACLFCILIWHSYWLHAREIDAEIEERGAIITKVLAETSEYELTTGKLSDLRLTIDRLMQSEKSIVSIDILDANKKILLHDQSADHELLNPRSFDLPVVKRIIWVAVISGQNGQPGAENAAQQTNRTETVGYVHVTMSPSELQHKQQHRFSIELFVAILALLTSGGLAIHLSRTLSLSFKSFIDACRSIRSGDYSVQMKTIHGGEIGELQESIKEMAESLQQSTDYLENKVTERTRELAQSRDEALRANAEKRKLIQKIDAILEEERKSIALEVHDELNASLITARLEAQRIVDLAATVPATKQSSEINHHALSIKNITKQLYENGRALVRRLRPESLDMLGLQGAVEEIVANLDSLHPGCNFHCEIRGEFSNLDSATAMSIYRIIQESLSNIVKHANAKRADVLLELDQNLHHAKLVVSDDGQGFESGKVTSGIGLIGIKERTFALNGQIEIRSSQNSGTTISIQIPV